MARIDRLPRSRRGKCSSRSSFAPGGISRYRLAKATKLPATRIASIIHGQRAITADAALRLAHFFGNSPQFWIRMQADYDLRRAQRKLQKRIEREVQPLNAA